MSEPSGPAAARIQRAIVDEADRPALVPFLTAGFPDPGQFLRVLEAVTREATVCEIGIPFTDPMADGVTIQRTSRAALDHGVTLERAFAMVEASERHCPVLFMSYLNPLLSYGADRLAARALQAGVDGFIVPDLPVDEDPGFRDTLTGAGLATVQLVTPLTDPDRRERLVAASTGFLYAVTRVGTTGAAVDLGPVLGFLDALREQASIPVCAGFGIREAAQVQALRGHADGVIVGSALMEVVERGEDPGAWLRALRPPA